MVKSLDHRNVWATLQQLQQGRVLVCKLRVSVETLESDVHPLDTVDVKCEGRVK